MYFCGFWLPHNDCNAILYFHIFDPISSILVFVSNASGYFYSSFFFLDSLCRKESCYLVSQRRSICFEVGGGVGPTPAGVAMVAGAVDQSIPSCWEGSDTPKAKIACGFLLALSWVRKGRISPQLFHISSLFDILFFPSPFHHFTSKFFLDFFPSILFYPDVEDI